MQVSRAGGRIPHSSRHGRELLYRTDEQRIMTGSYAIRAGCGVGQAVVMGTACGYRFTLQFRCWRDGRIAALMPAERDEDRQSEHHVAFIVFPSEIRRRLGSRVPYQRDELFREVGDNVGQADSVPARGPERTVGTGGRHPCRILVLRRPFRMIDHKYLDRDFPSSQSQSQLARNCPRHLRP